ncbi:hypothetical protein KPL70_016760 [Citrus sinensis]|nr:hypothetical protein KPL70_016760 [Citrus sinensis]
MLLKKLTACTSSNPNYDHASSLFPQNDVYPGEATWETRTTPFVKTDVCATPRFVLDAPAISKLNAKATSSINLRQRTKPSLAQRYMGNLIRMAATVCPGEGIELSGFVRQLRQAEILSKAYKRCKGKDYDWKMVQRLGLYDVDFGWGKPV